MLGLLVVALLGSCQNEQKSNPPAYELGWSDEFDQGKPVLMDTDKWFFRNFCSAKRKLVQQRTSALYRPTRQRIYQ